MKKILFLPIICVVILFSSCTAKQELEYYSNPDNYITVVGTVTHIEYNEEMDSLYLGLQQIPSGFFDNSFKIVGKNLLIAQESGIDQRLKYGEQIEFISAPRYFGDGYVMPIVGLVIDDETLLAFDQGYHNWIEWLLNPSAQ